MTYEGSKLLPEVAEMIQIEIDATEVFAFLRKYEVNLKPAVAAGMTRTMRAVEQHEIKAMEDQIDRPTPFTLDSLWLRPATASNLEVTLGIKPIASKYLTQPILGGDVDNTLVPVMANEKLNQYGNIVAKRKGMKYLAKHRKQSFVAKINNTLAVWQRVGKENVRALIFKDPVAPRAPRWRFYETGERVIESRVMRDISEAIRKALA